MQIVSLCSAQGIGEDGFIQQARFTQATSGDGEFFVTSGADKMVAAVAELLTVLANVVLISGLWPIRSVETVNAAPEPDCCRPSRT